MPPVLVFVFLHFIFSHVFIYQSASLMTVQVFVRIFLYMEFKIVNYVDGISLGLFFCFCFLYSVLLSVYLVYNFHMDLLNIVLVFKLRWWKFSINWDVFIKIQKITVIDFAHLTVFWLFNFIYFFSLKLIMYTLGRCSFFFLLMLKTH